MILFGINWRKKQHGERLLKYHIFIILKTLNLVEFLLKNGPPSAISSFKYDVYQFRSFSDYSAYHEGIDRG